MAKVFKISKHGLTCCPGCDRHIYAAAAWRETVCPFCQAPLVRDAASAATPSRRAGRLAVGLMSAALATSCAAQPVYGAPAPVYGGPPPVDAGVDADPADAELAPDVVFTAEYGAPPSEDD